MSVSRRKFLKAGGTTMLLPFLHSVSEARAAAPKKGEKPDKKLVIMYIPNGIVRRQFFPGEDQAAIPGFIGGFNADKTKEQRRFKNEPGIYDLEWTPTMQPLKAHGKDITMITGLDRTFKNGQDVHAQGASCYLTSLSPAAGRRCGHPSSERPHARSGDRRQGRTQDGAQHAGD